MDFLPTKITNPSSISVTHPLNYANEPKCVHRLRVKQVLSQDHGVLNRPHDPLSHFFS